MSKRLSHSIPLIVSSIAIASAIGMCLQILPSHAAFKPRGTVGKPGNRRGLATRGGGCKVSGLPTLTTLVPKNNMGLSASATPTFYWFVPQNTYQFVTFSLYTMDAEDKPKDLIYTSRVEVSGQPELASITLPERGTAPLETGVNYRWMVKLHCSESNRRGLSAMGWLNYAPPSPAVTNQLATAQPEDKYDVYAEAGYWYDAVRELVTQKQANPHNPKVRQAWKALMESEHVQLSQIAAQ